MNRRDSARIAAAKAREAAETYGWPEPRTVGSAVASDAFFPFADGLLAAAEAGATAVIQPGGSIRDDEVIAAADEAGPGDAVHRDAPLPPLRRQLDDIVLRSGRGPAAASASRSPRTSVLRSRNSARSSRLNPLVHSTAPNAREDQRNADDQLQRLRQEVVDAARRRRRPPRSPRRGPSASPTPARQAPCSAAATWRSRRRPSATHSAIAGPVAWKLCGRPSPFMTRISADRQRRPRSPA